MCMQIGDLPHCKSIYFNQCAKMLKIDITKALEKTVCAFDASPVQLVVGLAPHMPDQ